jgi:hypothetical protein
MAGGAVASRLICNGINKQAETLKAPQRRCDPYTHNIL